MIYLSSSGYCSGGGAVGCGTAIEGYVTVTVLDTVLPDYSTHTAAAPPGVPSEAGEGEAVRPVTDTAPGVIAPLTGAFLTGVAAGKRGRDDYIITMPQLPYLAG